MANQDVTKKVEALLNVEHFDEEVRTELLKLGPDAVDLLGSYATGSHPSGDPDIQGRAILVLAETHDQNCLPALQKALHSPDGDIRVRVLWALGRLGGADATQALCEAVSKSGCSDVERAHGIRSLGEQQTQEANDALSTLSKLAMPSHVKAELDDALAKMT